MFESLVSSQLNKYLGKFIDNISESDLKISIFGGDVVLKNLRVKPSALDDLDLPVCVKYGGSVWRRWPLSCS